MAELTKIFTGMEKGPEAIDVNFKELQTEVANNTASRKAAKVTISDSDIIDKAGITSASGTISRTGNAVSLAFYGKAGAPKSGTDMQDVLIIPAGFKPSAIQGQLPIPWAQSAEVSTQRAIIADVGGVYHLQWRMAAGNAYASGTWLTNDDFPTE